MLARVSRSNLRKDLRFFTRLISDKSDKPSNDQDNVSDEKSTIENKSQNKKSEGVDRVQELLKLMIQKPKTSEEEYREKFAKAPNVKLQKKQKLNVIKNETKKIEEEITKAAGEVAQAIGGDVKETESELLTKVLGITKTSTSLSDLLVGMKVDRTKETDDFIVPVTRGQQVKRSFDRTSSVQSEKGNRYIQRSSQYERRERDSVPQVTSVHLFNGEPLNIFSNKEPNFGTRLETWEKLKARELDLATTQPPTNYFQKMIMWTEQGKVWKFPINNEQGLEEEENVHFSEHVFLDQHLEDWCPKKGPIRHFMELVCVGLSKNPFYTVKEKIDHIMWYKEYFESKADLLKEVGVWNKENTSKPEAST